MNFDKLRESFADRKEESTPCKVIEGLEMCELSLLLVVFTSSVSSILNFMSHKIKH